MPVYPRLAAWGIGYTQGDRRHVLALPKPFGLICFFMQDPSRLDPPSSLLENIFSINISPHPQGGIFGTCSVIHHKIIDELTLLPFFTAYLRQCNLSVGCLLNQNNLLHNSKSIILVSFILKNYGKGVLIP